MKKNNTVKPFWDIKPLRPHLLTIIRSFFFILAFGLTSSFALDSNVETQLDINVRNASLEDFFEEIQSQSEYLFFYKDDIIYTAAIFSIAKGEKVVPFCGLYGYTVVVFAGATELGVL